MNTDIFNRFAPKPFYDWMVSMTSKAKDMTGKRARGVPAAIDLDERFRVMDMFDDYVQILSYPLPIESYCEPPVSGEMSKLLNDSFAELIQKYPDRFLGFVAVLPMNDPDGILIEVERAIKDLGAVGVLVNSNINGRPLSSPETIQIFDYMNNLDLPIWIHPWRGADFPDYKSESKSHYEIWWTFGWPYETSVTMAHLVFSGIFDRLPDIKIITHHMGGLVPYLEGRIGPGWDQLGSRTSDEDYTLLLKQLKRRPLDYFKLFYSDTCHFGARDATILGLKFFGVDRTFLGTDMQNDPEKGPGYIRETIKIIDNLNITNAEREAIYEGNARRLLKLK